MRQGGAASPPRTPIPSTDPPSPAWTPTHPLRACRCRSARTSRRGRGRGGGPARPPQRPGRTRSPPADGPGPGSRCWDTEGGEHDMGQQGPPASPNRGLHVALSSPRCIYASWPQNSHPPTPPMDPGVLDPQLTPPRGPQHPDPQHCSLPGVPSIQPPSFPRGAQHPRPPPPPNFPIGSRHLPPCRFPRGPSVRAPPTLTLLWGVGLWHPPRHQAHWGSLVQVPLSA